MRKMYIPNKPITSVYETPQWLFDALDAEFHFTVDVAANDENHKCTRYYTEEQDGLRQPWEGETVWCNPPYGKAIPEWVAKADAEEGATSVFLLPVYTDRVWFHRYVYHNPRVEIRFIQGRVAFTGMKNTLPWPLMIVVFHKK